MKRIYSSEVRKEMKEALVSGWVDQVRDFGGLKFIILKDKEGILQITIPKKKVSKEVADVADSLTKESVISAVGEVKKSKQAPNGFELVPEKLQIISKAQAPVPLDLSGKIKSDLSKRLDWRFLDLRNEKSLSIFKLRARLFEYTVDFFRKEGFININTPKLTVAGVESGAELFPVVYFDKEAFLSQSPQVYKQMMVAAGFEKVYEIGVVFRAEKSRTTRHLTEFTGIDFEMGFIESEHDVMDVIENYMKYIMQQLKKNNEKELEMLGIKVRVPEKIPRIEIKEARKLLAEKGKKIPDGEDLDAEAEEMMGRIVKDKYNEEFVFVYNYPWEKRPFYHMKPDNDPNGTKSFDLIWNGLEVATGAQREHRYEILKAQAKEKGVDLDGMKDYAAIFKYGCPPHGGVGFGLDRFVESLLKLDNIREGILLPRDPDRLTP